MSLLSIFSKNGLNNLTKLVLGVFSSKGIIAGIPE
jgi:hypothetical protein